jgi:hypothetical protein
MVRYTLRQLFSVNAVQKRGSTTVQYGQKIQPNAKYILEKPTASKGKQYGREI